MRRVHVRACACACAIHHAPTVLASRHGQEPSFDAEQLWLPMAPRVDSVHHLPTASDDEARMLPTLLRARAAELGGPPRVERLLEKLEAAAEDDPR